MVFKYCLTFVTRAAFPIVLTVVLSGCTAINGMQTPIANADLEKSICPRGTDVTTFESKSGRERGEFRDRIVLDCVKAINHNYFAFKSLLHKDAVDSHLIPDILGLGLSGAATLTKGNTAKQFSQGALVALGIGASIDKDVFFQQTLPAIESAMDTTRDTILKSIVESENSDPEGTKYTLARAGFDLDAFESAGNIYAAISQLTTTANQTAQNAHAELVAAQANPTTYRIVELTPEQNARLNKLMGFIQKLTAPSDKATLDSIATKLGFGVIAGEDNLNERVRLIDLIEQSFGTAVDRSALLSSYETKLTGIYKP